MEQARNNGVDVALAKRIRRSLSISSKGKQIIERTKDKIDEEDPDKSLEKYF